MNHTIFEKQEKQLINDKTTLEDCLKVIDSWDNNLIKKLCISQFDKALNKGSCFKATDSLLRYQNQLGIPDQIIDEISILVEKIFQEVTILKKLNNFKRQINSSSQIFLPCQCLPFRTSTTSKKQVKIIKSSNIVKNWFFSPITGNVLTAANDNITAISRILSGCEIVLILMAVVSLWKTGLLPINYQEDSLLLVGPLTNDEWLNAFNIINNNFKKLANQFLKHDCLLEFRNKV